MQVDRRSEPFDESDPDRLNSGLSSCLVSTTTRDPNNRVSHPVGPTEIN